MNDSGEANWPETDLTASEESVNVDRRWWGTSRVQGCVLAAGLLLLGAGCAILGSSFLSSRNSAPVGASTPLMVGPSGNATPLTAEDRSTTRNTEAQAHSLFAGLPLMFEPNVGQAGLDASDSRARFVARGSGYSLFLGSEGAILSQVSRGDAATEVDSLEMRLAGANPSASVTAIDALPGKSNYLVGNDPAKWRSSVPQFARVRYDNVYPGINLVFYGSQGHLEYDFQVAPGADPEQAELEFNGASNVELSEGDLIVRTGHGSVRLRAPSLYQEIAGRRQPVEGKFTLRGNKRAGFSVGQYDRSRELIIDPILSFSTYFGGTGDEHSTSVVVDGSFNIYLTGSTTSPNLPAVGVFQTTLAGVGPNVYVAKITPPLGSVVAALDYVTYLGGNGSDTPVGIKVDGAGDPFVAGTTSSTNFPTSPTNAYQRVPETGSVGTTHVFVTELKYDGTALLYSSYLSGNNTDAASGMTIDASGFIYVTGTTMSTDGSSNTVMFPASNVPAQYSAYQAYSRSSIQFFVTKVNTAGSGVGSISFSTYFGGADSDTTPPVAIGGGIAVDTSGNIYFSGTTNFLYSGCSGCSSTDFPILNAYQPCLDTPPPATIVNPPTCSTTTSTTDSDAFVAKLNPIAAQGQQLVWSTYVGGSAVDSSSGVALDPGAANVYIVGTTDSTDIGTSATTLSTSASYQHCLDQPTVAAGTACTPPANPPNDAFVAKLTNPTTTSSTTTAPVNVALTYFSYLGGSGAEAGTSITVDSASGALITGWTQSPDFPVLPTPSSIQTNLTGAEDAFIARLNTVATVGQTTLASWATYFGGSTTSTGTPSTTLGTGIALDVNQNTYIAGETDAVDLQVAKPLQAANGGTNDTYDAFATQLTTAVSLSIQGVLTLGTSQTFISAGNPATFTYTITNNGPDLASNIAVTANLSPSITNIAFTNVTASVSSGTCGGASTNAVVSCSLPSLQSGSTATLTITATPAANGTGNQASFNGGTVQVIGPGNIVYAQTSVPAQMSDFTVGVTPSNASVPAAGDTAVYQVQLTPHPVYTTSITLSCTNLPTGAACNFTNSPATLTSTSGITSTLNLTTTARPITTTTTSLFLRRFYAVWLTIPGLTLLGAGFSRNRRRRRIAGIFMLCLLFALLLLLPACSHTTTQPPVSGTPAGNYTITVTATAGSDTKSQTITLTVP